WRAFVHASQARPADLQAALGALSAADEAAADQVLRQLRPALAGRNGHLHGETSSEPSGECPKLLDPMPRTIVNCFDLQLHASLCSCRFSTEQVGSLFGAGCPKRLPTPFLFAGSRLPGATRL